MPFSYASLKHTTNRILVLNVMDKCSCVR